MPTFKEMDPELVTKLLEGYENELGPATRKLEAFYRQFKCPKCKGLICRERLPSCVDWCKAARECIGEEKWKKLKDGGK